MPLGNAKLNIKAAPTLMRAVAGYFPPRGGGSPLTEEDVRAQLAAMNITVGIKDDVIKTICGSARPLLNVVIAEGVKPKTGESARIEMLIDTRHERKPQLRPDGSMDYRDLGELFSAQKDMPLYRKIPATRGEPGFDIYGTEIPGILGRDIALSPGKNTRIDPGDPNMVVAAVEGEVIIKKSRLEISEVHRVDGDIDYSTGNISFNGSVKISGTVKSGFQVSCDGNIEIKGNVEDASVTAENDVVVHGGFVGTGAGLVKAGRDVTVKFVENQRIEAGRDITINGESFHATLMAGRSVTARGPRGVIVGGRCEAAHSVQAFNFGSIAATPTVIRLGINPDVVRKIQAIEQEIAESETAQEKVRQGLEFLYRQKADNKTLPPDKEELLARLEQTHESLPGKIEACKADLAVLMKARSDIAKAYAIALSRVFPKVQVAIGRQIMNISDFLGPSRFKLVGSDIIRISV